MTRHLVGNVWHTTHPSRLEAMQKVGAVLAEPQVPDAERWKTSRGPDYFPFVRHLGGVSLFDFRGFDADAYDDQYVMSNWRTFVPCRQDWVAAAWIEFDRDAIMDHFVGPTELLERWKASESYRHTIMPGIEAAYLGNLPLCAAKSAMLTSADGDQVLQLDLNRLDAVDLAALQPQKIEDR